VVTDIQQDFEEGIALSNPGEQEGGGTTTMQLHNF